MVKRYDFVIDTRDDRDAHPCPVESEDGEYVLHIEHDEKCIEIAAMYRSEWHKRRKAEADLDALLERLAEAEKERDEYLAEAREANVRADKTIGWWSDAQKDVARYRWLLNSPTVCDLLRGLHACRDGSKTIDESIDAALKEQNKP